MTDQMLPNYIEPEKVARERQQLRGSIDTGGMDRVNGLVVEPLSAIELKLSGGVEEQGYRYVRCEFTVVVKLTCQRCLQPVSYSIEVDSKLVPVQSELFDDELPDDYEPLILDGKIKKLSELIEDELLLGLPIVARHDYGNCPVALPYPVSEEQDTRAGKKPFAGLKDMLRQQNRKNDDDDEE